MNKKTLNLLGQLLLLIATLIWGTSFFILKETITAVPTFYVLLLRFIPSGIILLLVFSKKTFKMGKGTFKRGIILGLILSGAYVTQTLGLTLTTPARNAFVTSSYVVMIPFLVWALKKAPPKSYNVITAITCLIGIGFVSFSNGF
ncbi:MAG: EamA family transporter, partial [Clostridia bacterium]|nr:EamA family transporter [Clostridia bacterium]